VYVFPNARSPKGDRPMSEAAVLVALRNLGYAKDQMSGHGFRHMASTLLHERGFDHDLIERQMSHSIGSSVAQVYDHAVRLSERRNLMQEWADYLDSLKNGEPS
jgi:integrase